MSIYKSDLQKQLKKKRELLNELLEQRNNPDAFRENFWNIQSGINSLTVDIKTVKDRLANLDKPRPNLPNHENVQTINKYI